MTATFDGEKTIDGDMLEAPDDPAIPEAGTAEASYLQKLIDNDPLTLLMPLLTSRGYRLRWGDGRLTAEFTQSVDTPWHYVKMATNLDCYLWHSVLFNIVSRRTGQRFVPSPCQQCWKTVVRPTTIVGLFALLELQQSFPFACKCGIEVRKYTPGNYGGYHYAKSQDEGLAMWEHVKAAVEAHPDLGPDVSVILKRGCSEYEREVGPSENWSVTAAQLRVERMVTDMLDHVPNIQPMPAPVVTNVHRRWIEFAHSIGDMTYLKYTNGVPIERPFTLYHHLKDAPADPVEVLNKKGGRTGYWEYEGKRYKKDDLPAVALRNGHLRACGVPSMLNTEGERVELPIHPMTGVAR